MDIRVNNKWKIWFRSYDSDGNITGTGVMMQEYIKKGNAERVAKKHFDRLQNHKWVVSKENPFIKTRIVFNIHCFDRELVIDLENKLDFEQAENIMNEAYDKWCEEPDEVGDVCCEEYICECLDKTGIKFTWINEN